MTRNGENNAPVTENTGNGGSAGTEAEQPVKVTKDETNHTQSSYYDKIVDAQFPGDKNIVDVITQYYWTMNKPKEVQGEDTVSNVPFLYAIEYKQKYGVTLTNLINNIYGLVNSGTNIGENIITGLGAILGKVGTTVATALDIGDANDIKNRITEGAKGAAKAINKAAGATGEAIRTSNVYNETPYLSSEFLKPYQFLYSLKGTGKKFCFPFFGDNAAQFVINNSFSSDGSISLLSKAVTEGINKLANGLTAIAADVNEFTNFLSAATDNKPNGFSMYNIEKAKAFSFPTDGKKLSVTFPLFNTIKKDEWKNNYKFIVLFGLRNMLYRKNNVQYYPPMIYDVSTPGYGRLPLCYVSSFSVKPVGMTRVKSINMNFISGDNNDKESTVIVPEAWIVQIDFQSLIADSANQFLSSIFDLPIKANIVNE